MMEAKQPIHKLSRPLEQFMRVESASGIMLILFTLIAMGWANSPWQESYHYLMELPLTLGVGNWTLTLTLHHLVNDALMCIFFFIIGLELKREFVSGELRELGKAALALFAAVGGMIVPALIYLAFHWGTPTASGWGVPMATDIAFAVGVLTLLGNRIPAALKIFLLTLAVVDDIGAIIVIAIFYSETIHLLPLVWAAAGFVVVGGLYQLGVRNIFAYFLVVVPIWLAFLASGIHTTIMGVILGLMASPHPTHTSVKLRSLIDRQLVKLHEAIDNNDNHEKIVALKNLSTASFETMSMIERLELFFHPWNLFYVLPLFALMNAGFVIHLAGALDPVAYAVMLGLVIGKPAGITLASWLAVKAGVARLPDGVAWSHIVAIGLVAGIGFTMSIFVATLAFTNPASLDAAKIGIFGASLISGLLGLAILSALFPKNSTINNSTKDHQA